MSVLKLELLDDRYPALHGLRVLGILCVLQFHVTMFFSHEGFPPPASLTTTSYRAFFGMDLFFVLSGFLIGSILLRQRKPELRSFYLRRFVRTFPPYYVVLVALALFTPLTAAQRTSLPYELAFLTNFRDLDGTKVVMGWGWSLAFEEQFYLIAPLIVGLLVRIAQPRRQIVLLVVGILAALVVRVAIWRSRPEGFSDDELRQALYFSPYTRFDTLLTGVLVALIHRAHGDWFTAQLSVPRVRGMFIVGILTCLWLLMDPRVFGQHLQLMRVLSWGTITSVMYFLVVLLLLHSPPSPIARFLGAPTFRRLATLGYGVYLAHVPIGEHVVSPLAKRLVASGVSVAAVWFLAVGALFALSLVVAWVLHVVVEKPMFRLRDRWLHR